MTELNAKIPAGPLAQKWSNHKAHINVVSPANKRKLDVIIVGTGLAGGSAAASLAELGYNVTTFCYQDSPRRAHSIAAQGGINAAKNYQNDGDSVYRLFYDTVKGGDYRAREANVYRLAEVSNNIIDQCVAQGVPFAREYGGLLDNRSFGGAQVSRTFYAKGQTGQQLLLGAYSALSRQVNVGTVKLYTRYEMEDVVIIDGRARGIIAKNLVTGKLERFAAHAVVIATGGYGNAYFLSTNAMACNCSAAMACYRKGAWFANPAYVQIHPTCIPVHGDKQSKLTLMSESLRNDGRIWVPKKLEDAKKLQEGTLQGKDIPEEDRDYYLERRYPAFGNLVPRDVASRAAKERCDKGYGVNNTGLAVFLDFSEAINRLGKDVVAQRYGNLFDMYEEITDVSPYENPMMIYPAIHYTMGGIWVDYELMTSIKGLFAIGECNFSDHGANRLGANSLSEVLVFGHTAGDGAAAYAKAHQYEGSQDQLTKDSKKWLASFEEVTSRPHDGNRTVPEIRDDMVKTMWFKAGVFRNGPDLEAAAKELSVLEDQYKNCYVGDTSHVYNTAYEQYVELGNLLQISQAIVQGAIARKESRGAHTRRDYPKRDDQNFLKHTLVFKEDGKYRFEYKDVVVTKYEPKERKY